jgi:DNA-directed RNA polymerase subunit RPC12/RpoP
MNTKSTTLRLLLTSLALGALVSVAQAGPGLQYWETLRHTDQFQATKPGDKLVYVCSTCKTISEVDAATQAQIDALHSDGGSVSCPACKLKTTVVLKKTRNDPVTKTEVVYVDASGKEVGFFAKAAK